MFFLQSRVFKVSQELIAVHRLCAFAALCALCVFLLLPANSDVCRHKIALLSLPAFFYSSTNSKGEYGLSRPGRDEEGCGGGLTFFGGCVSATGEISLWLVCAAVEANSMGLGACLLLHLAVVAVLAGASLGKLVTGSALVARPDRTNELTRWWNRIS